jgi:type I restriction enzyme R subunit
MATGSGKTRMVIAAIDQLMRAGWVKRALFLADRVALVNHAIAAFKTHLPSVAPVNLVTDKDTEGRVYVSTYPTMMGLIDEMKNGIRRFGAGHFDLIVIDEAHRSVYRKYRAIFDYFDCTLIGLTATPRDEIDRDTYSLFDLERGVPTDAYDLDEAVADGFLVPPVAVSVPLKFQREGIRYDDLSDAEKEQWDALEWTEDGQIPDQVSASALNAWLFNIDTVDKVLKHVMTRGVKVADGDRLGKTIIFAKNHDHAVFIAERFNKNYPHFKGHVARVIDFKTEYAQSLIDDFSDPDKPPHIAISVDMLDTGIDVPEVVNLVFFKIVRSKTKFWQMIGRGTRLRPDLFGPGQHKEHFLVFDFCQNFEFFNENPKTTDGALGRSLGERLFVTRVELIGEIVRPKRRLVEKYQDKAAWQQLSAEDRAELAEHLAGLPSACRDDDLAAKQFDSLLLLTQLAVLRVDPAFMDLKARIGRIAAKLEALANIPMVAAHLQLIAEVQTEDYWQDITLPMLEHLRRRLRSLVKLIEPGERKTVYSDFEDEIGEAAEFYLTKTGNGTDKRRFLLKVRHFLQQHDDHISIHKLRRNEQLTPQDLTELERIFADEGIAGPEDLERIRNEGGIGLLIRSLVGLDREAAKQALAGFIDGRELTANQIEFINLIIDHLTERGLMDPRRLYESPFTDFDDQGVTGVFSMEDAKLLVQALKQVEARAAA